MDLSAFYAQFRDETTENIRVVSDGLLALEQHPDDRPVIDRIFRALHTIKGSSRVLGLVQIGQVAHVLENLFGAVREGKQPLTPALSTDLLRGSDAIIALTNAAVEGRLPPLDVDALIRSLIDGSPTPPVTAAAPAAPAPTAEKPVQHVTPAPTPTAPATPATPEAPPVAPSAPAATLARRQTVRVRVDRLDRLLNLAGELAVDRQLQWGHLQVLAQLETIMAQQQHALVAFETELNHLRFSHHDRDRLDVYLNTMLNDGAQARALLQRQLEQLNVLFRRHDLLIDDLEQEVMTVRLMAVGTVFANLPRAVRDLCQATGKEVELMLSGEETEMDRKVLELLGDPLTHLLRNAIDHGIEAPEDRIAQGKPRRGQVRVSAETSGGYVQITISDDGRGIQPYRLRESAVRKGLISPEAAIVLTDQEALDLVFVPGFSTSQLITDISGRGVGLDVVRTNIAELGGHVQLTSDAGKGTMVKMVLPLTLVTTRVLLLEAGQRVYALPASGCHGILWVRGTMVRSIEGQVVVQYNDQSIALVQLERLLGFEGQPLDDDLRRPAVLLGAQQRPIAVLVDSIIDEREVVVKPLGPLLERYRQYAGASQLGDGRLVLLLNAGGLLALARGAAPTRVVGRRKRRWRLLVAEDSFSTRELLRSILQAAGYEVSVAVDGQDAFDRLRGERFDLVVSDVEMPRLNGFQLTTRIRQELRLDEMPVVIMTSLASDEHRRQGLEAGAQAYIVKGQFDQNNLIETIRQLLGG